MLTVKGHDWKHLNQKEEEEPILRDYYYCEIFFEYWLRAWNSKIEFQVKSDRFAQDGFTALRARFNLYPI